MHLFYAPLIQGDHHYLDETESRHAARVLRLKAGDRVVVVDGKGGWYEGEVEEPHPKKCRIRVISHDPDHLPLPYSLHIAISPTKSMDRFEWFLEKATEIGITEITPLRCQRTERSRLNHERMERILVSAMKQSLRAYRPSLNDAQSLEDFLAQEHAGTRGIAHCIDTANAGLTARSGIRELPRDTAYTLLVGPEGDFTEAEVTAAVEAGYIPFHLGSSRLRTETAGVFVCAAMHLLSRP